MELLQLLAVHLLLMPAGVAAENIKEPPEVAEQAAAEQARKARLMARLARPTPAAVAVVAAPAQRVLEMAALAAPVLLF